MNNFWQLTRYEYKKILRKKSTIIILILTVAVTLLSSLAILVGNVYVDGVPTETYYEAMKTERSYARAHSGLEIDSSLLLEMSTAYGKVPAEGKYSETKEYNLYARKYSHIYGIARTIYGELEEKFSIAQIQKLTPEMADSLYDIRREAVEREVSSLMASEATKEHLLQLDSQVETPFVFDYAEGYARFFGIMYTTGIIICFASAILLASIFAGEYTSGADQLLLSSRNGKKTLIYAKLFTSVTLSGGICLFLTLLTYLQCMFTYGWDGINAPIQLFMPLTVYPFSIGTTVLLYGINIFMATQLTIGITVFLSSRMKTPFGVIVITCIFLMFPMFISDPERSVLLSNFLSMLPTNMMAIWNLLSLRLFEFGRISIEPYIICPILCAILSAFFLFFAKRGFEKHQIG